MSSSTDVEILREFDRGNFTHALFDFDGTISTLREGWEGIMAPVCINAICGGGDSTPEIEAAVRQMIDETTGIQTILQMERLVEMVREHGIVPDDEVLDAHGYKAVYNEQLLVPVRERIARIESGELDRRDATIHGSTDMVRLLKDRGLTMYIFSGTDRGDVRNEAAIIGVAGHFDEIWGALRTFQEYSKEQILRDLIAEHDLHGSQVIVIGDGPVEIRNAKQFGCVAMGVCSDEVKGHGWNERKRARLTDAGADILVPDFTAAADLVAMLFGEDG